MCDRIDSQIFRFSVCSFVDISMKQTVNGIYYLCITLEWHIKIYFIFIYFMVHNNLHFRPINWCGLWLRHQHATCVAAHSHTIYFIYIIFVYSRAHSYINKKNFHHSKLQYSLSNPNWHVYTYCVQYGVQITYHLKHIVYYLSVYAHFNKLIFFMTIRWKTSKYYNLCECWTKYRRHTS